MATNFGTFSASAVLTAAQMNSFGGAWDSYTPTWTNVTVGNGTNLGRVQQIGRTTIFVAQLTHGTTTSVTGAVSVSLPYTAARTFGGVFDCALFDASFGYYMAFPKQTSTTVLTLQAMNTSGTYSYETATSATVPATWTSTDVFYVAGIYEASADPT